MLPKFLPPQVSRAVVVATYLHANQTDKSGSPYIAHPLRVLGGVIDALPNDLIAQEAAVLHDVIEDCGQTVQSLIELGVTPEAAELVGVLSKRKGESYEQFLNRILAHGIRAVTIKREDVWDNSDPGRLEKLDPITVERLRAKYSSAMSRLGFFEDSESPS